MKTTLLTLLTLTVALASQAQTQPKRSISIPNFGVDSLHIPLNEQYLLIEDSCASMTRHVRFNRETSHFYGAFTDLSRSDANLVISKGFYTRDGLKHGPFEVNYTNGKPRIRGNYANNNIDGKWELFYEDGSQKLVFSATDNVISISDAWDEKGKHFVNEGNGKYVIASGFITWSGQLQNGKPHGTWIAYNTNDISRKAINTERFRNGEFVKGVGVTGPYTNGSRILLLNTNDFPYLNAEKMALAPLGCGPSPKGYKAIGAQYRIGTAAFSEEMKRVISSYLSTVDLRPYDTDLTLTGEVSEQGKIINFKHTISMDLSITNGLIRALGRLPLLEPATVNGAPARQPFEVKFRFYQGSYQFTYRFLPIPKDNI